MPGAGARAKGVRLKRRQDWARQLEAEVLCGLHQPFVWHDNDCASAAARWVEAMTGVDLFAPFRAARLRYRSERTAATRARRFLESQGVAAVEPRTAFAAAIALQCARHGLTDVAPAYAQRGDLLLLEVPEDEAGATGPVTLGLVYLNGSDVVTQAGTGVRFLPRRALLAEGLVVRAWGIPL